MLRLGGRDAASTHGTGGWPATRAEIAALLDGGGVGIAVLDADLRFLHVNDALATMNGVAAAEHIGRTPSQVLPAIAGTVEDLMRRVIATGLPVSEQIVGTTAAAPGHRRHWRATYRAIRLTSGECGVGVVVTEESERLRAEWLGETRLNLLDAGEELAGVGSLVYDHREGRITVSRGFATLAGLPCAGDYPAGDVFEVVHPEKRAQLAQDMARLAVEGGEWSYACQLVRTDGSVRWVEVRSRGERTPASAGPRVQTVVIDVTDRRTTERLIESLRARQAALGRVSDLIGAGVEHERVFQAITEELVALGARGSALVRCEDGGSEVVQCTGDLPLRRGDRLEPGPGGLRIAVPGLPDALHAGVRGRDAHDEAVRHLAAEEVVVDGHRWGALLLGSPRSGDVVAEILAGDFARLASAAVVSSRARSALNRMNAELERRVLARTAELRATIAELDAFAYTVSHDLRGPLRAVHGAAQLLRQGGIDAPRAERLLGLVDETTADMDRLIEELLHMARLGAQPLEPERIAMNGLVDRVVAECIDQADNPVTVTRDALPDVLGSRPLVRQVLVNLIANAVKFTRDEPHPTLHIGFGATPGEEPAFTIRDNGIGFPEGGEQQAFEPFLRLHDGERFEGSGAGLAIVRRIVERHGGRVWAATADGGGARISFTLPLAPER